MNFNIIDLHNKAEERLTGKAGGYMGVYIIQTHQTVMKGI